MSSARAQTEVEAANEALGHLRQPAIADLADRNPRARAMRQFFGSVRDELLRAKWWSFAKGWSRPSADTAQSLGPLKARYILPADCLRVRYLADGNGGVFDEDSGAWDIENAQATLAGAEIEATVLVTNIAGPLVGYTRQVTAVRLWDPIFLSGFGYELAARGASKLGGSQSKADSLHATAMQKLDSAAAIDSKEASRKSVSPLSSVILARRGFRRV